MDSHELSNFYYRLEDERIAIEPLTADHIQELTKLNGDPDIWKWFSEDLTEEETMVNWMRERLKESKAFTKMSYAIRNLENDEIAGTSSYGNIDWPQRVMEIGWTWIGTPFIGTGINKHMKYLMLSHAFDVIGLERVEIRTDEINLRSRRAIEKIGAQLDGILRNHRFTQGGRRRNTVVYSIVKSEWPDIRSTIFKEF